METIMGMIWGAAALVFSQLVLAWVSPRWIEQVKANAARKRFDAEPRVHIGATYRKICRLGTDTPIIGRCQVVSLATGRIELLMLDDPDAGCLLPMTLREFEGLYPLSEPPKYEVETDKGISRYP